MGKNLLSSPVVAGVVVAEEDDVGLCKVVEATFEGVRPAEDNELWMISLPPKAVVVPPLLP